MGLSLPGEEGIKGFLICVENFNYFGNANSEEE
jgi:hypothetical protein